MARVPPTSLCMRGLELHPLDSAVRIEDLELRNWVRSYVLITYSSVLIVRLNQGSVWFSFWLWLLPPQKSKAN